jgi:hypothetical protein
MLPACPGPAPRCTRRVQPVGDVLRGDAQRRAVLHQPHVVDVRHLGAADALVDPAHHIAEDALRVVVELALDVLGRPVPRRRQRDGQDVVDIGAPPARAPAFLHRGTSTVVMRACSVAAVGEGTQACWRRRGDGRSSAPASPPSGRAWPTCPCRSAHGPAGRIPARHRRSSSRRPDPGLALHVALADHRPRPPSRCGSRRRCGRGSRC